MDKITLSNMDTLEITFKLVEKENQDEPISKIEQAMIYLSNDKSENSFIVNALEGGQYKVVNIEHFFFFYYLNFSINILIAFNSSIYT